MITTEQLKLYIKLDGDIDMYQRLDRNPNSSNIMSDDEWGLLDDLRQRIVIRKNGLESADYGKSTDILLEKHFRTKEALEIFHDYSIGTKTKSSWWKFW